MSPVRVAVKGPVVGPWRPLAAVTRDRAGTDQGKSWRPGTRIGCSFRARYGARARVCARVCGRVPAWARGPACVPAIPHILGIRAGQSLILLFPIGCSLSHRYAYALVTHWCVCGVVCVRLRWSQRVWCVHTCVCMCLLVVWPAHRIFACQMAYAGMALPLLGIAARGHRVLEARAFAQVSVASSQVSIPQGGSPLGGVPDRSVMRPSHRVRVSKSI